MDLIDETDEESDESVDVNTDAVKRPTGKRRKKKVTSRKLWQQEVSVLILIL